MSILKRQFIVSRFSDWRSTNPDVLDYSKLTGCTTRITEDKDEITTKDAEGKEVSFMPPRYRYTYDFKAVLNVSNPYFDEMRFEPTTSTTTGVACKENCSLCVSCCMYGAISRQGEQSVNVDRSKCMGCGLCTSVCPAGKLSLGL